MASTVLGGWPGLLIAGRKRPESALRKNKRCVSSIATHPCKERKDGATSVGMMHARVVEGEPPALAKPQGVGSVKAHFSKSARNGAPPVYIQSTIRTL